MAIKTESLRQFYERTKQTVPDDLLAQNSSGHFNVKRRAFLNRCAPFNRRDFYKICLVIGKAKYVSESGETIIDQPSLIFSNPSLARSFQSLSEEQSGFYCLFNEAFLPPGLRQEVKYESPLFNETRQSVFTLQQPAVDHFCRYFSDMETLLASEYNYKHDMIRSILQTLIHESIRLQEPSPDKKLPPSDRVIARFFNLLDQSFPVDSPQNPLKMPTPAAYAAQLNVHVNHLNTVVKRFTGKTTRDIIHERIIAEAKILLLNTDWDAAEIAYALGFEYPSHFNKYFKQYTLTTPLLFRADTRKYKN